MLLEDFNKLFTRDVLDDLLPPQLSNDISEALYGDATEGAYDISLAFKDYDSEQKKLFFELQLHERPGKCLACNLTYGLPKVFSGHPLLNIEGMVEKIESLLDEGTKCIGWELGKTQTPSSSMHAIPLTVKIED